MMTERQFKHEMSKAKTFYELEPEKSSYWKGYQRGLRRNYHGDAFGTEEEHRLYMEAFESQDSERKRLGEGYRDALQL